MFGFLRAGNRNPAPVQPVVKPDGVLVSKEDIYRESYGAEPILLIRKGYEVHREDLPRLIRNGAQPHQFELKRTVPLPEAAPGTDILSSPGHNAPMGAMSTPLSRRRRPGIRKNALILESDGKHLKRLIDCLFVCGLSLDRIHTVRVSHALEWAVGKYQPQLLFLPYRLSNGPSGLELLSALSENGTTPEKAVLTMAFRMPNAEQAQKEKAQWEKDCRRHGAQFLAMPANRHDVRDILQT